MLWAYVVLAAVLVVAAVTDVRTGKIHNWLTYPAICGGLIGHAMVGFLAGPDAETLGLVGSAGGLAAGFCPMLVFWLAGGIGGGDAKLMGAVGALAGWRFALSAMFFGFAVAFVMAVFVIIRRRVARRTAVRIWRWLVLVFCRAKPAAPAGEESPKIPFGLALSIGSLAALVEALVLGAEAEKLIGF